MERRRTPVSFLSNRREGEVVWIPLPNELDRRGLNLFLKQEGIERWLREVMIQDVVNAVCRYGQEPDRENLKCQLEDFLARRQQIIRSNT
jgi:hypothetical protein